MLEIIPGKAFKGTERTRREFLRVGGLSALGLTLHSFLRLQHLAAASGRTTKKDVNCILLWMAGGPSHIDTFDPKPLAPPEIRGEYKTISTMLPGIRFTEHLPLLARQTDKFSLIRGLDPQNSTHGMAEHLMMSGHPFNPALAFPCFGSVVAKERGPREGIFPFVQLGPYMDRRFHGGIAGFLGRPHDPFEVDADPNTPTFKVPDLSLESAAEHTRLDRRFSLLGELDRYQAQVEKPSPAMKVRDVFYERAHGLITSPAAKRAFNLNQEPDRVRERYGRNIFGQSCLLARRLIEAGVHFVTVTFGGWDTHLKNCENLKVYNLPPLDRAYAALLEDVWARGLLESTLVVWLGDFGRTPLLNAEAGRDHWGLAGVACMGGGGVKTGQVVGATNRLGEFVTDGRVTPQDIAATVYHTLGIPLNTWYRTPDGRSLELVPQGKPVRQLVA